VSQLKNVTIKSSVLSIFMLITNFALSCMKGVLGMRSDKVIDFVSYSSLKVTLICKHTNEC